MKLRAWGIAALALCVLTAGAAANAAQKKSVSNVDFQEEQYSEDDGQMLSDDVDLANYQNVISPAIGPGPRGGGYIGGIPSLLDRPIQIVAGAQYFYARPSFSQQLAYVEDRPVEGRTEFVQYDFNYNSSYGLYGGFYLCDCGGALLFNFNRLNSGSSFTAQDDTSTQNPSDIYGPYEVNGNLGPLEGFANVDLKSYDIAFSKAIPLGGPMCCGCGDDCCGDDCCEDKCCDGGCDNFGCNGGGCGGCGCPAWDITWSGGVRFADVGWNRGATAYDTTTVQGQRTFVDGYNTRMNFNGFGGRVGLQGRRYIGKRGLFSLFAQGNWSLLSGTIDVTTDVTNNAGTATYHTKCTHIVPVTEIMLGGTMHLGCHANISAGYFWSAWHDLGMRDEYAFQGRFQTASYDDANILGFDGLFVNGQVAF